MFVRATPSSQASPRWLSKTTRRVLVSVSTHSVLFFVSALFLIPLLYILSTSFKAPGEHLTSSDFLPRTWEFAKYAEVWNKANVLLTGKNSLIITIVTTGIGLVLASLAAYGFSRLEIPGRDFFFLLILTGLMLPSATLIVPLFRMNLWLGALNTYAAVIGPYVALGLPFSILLMKYYFDTLPREIEDSALVDGANRLTIYLAITLPLTRPIVGTMAIFIAMGTWNEFLLAMLFLTDPAMRTLPLTIIQYTSQYFFAWEHIFALLVMMTLPVILLFLVLQKQFIAGLTSGAVKG